MNEHSFQVLEFDKLREEIAKFANIDEVIERILDLEPYKNINDVKHSLQVSWDFFEFTKYDEGVELTGVKNIRKYLKKIELIGTYLDPEELFYTKQNMRLFRRVIAKLEEYEGKYRTLYSKFKGFPTYKGLEDIIEKAINENKEIKDDASLELRDIRMQKKNISANIKSKFDSIMSDPVYSKAIQEKIITVRDGRSVIPVKTDFKGQIKGIEHDRSASGQTVFIEPLSIVSLNNKNRELEVREREEIRKILLRLSDQLRINKDGIYQIADALFELDYINAKTTYALEQKCKMPKIMEREVLNFVSARHPFIPKGEVVPLTFEIGKSYNTLLITGPNTGGKTVALKTAGLLTLMALSGILIPAEEKTEVGMFTGVYADIGDEQSIQQSLSSFSAHLKNIQAILENVNQKSLVLLDELGSGTDPIEGAAFAMSVIDYLKSRKVKSFISTHYSEVKAYGYNEEDVETASMEFNAETLSPTYHLLLGIPGESNALKIARKLGVSEEIVLKAEKYISEEDKKVESMISNIKDKTAEVDKLKEEAEAYKEEAERQKRLYEDKLIDFEKEKNKMVEEAYMKADKLVKDAQAKAKALIDKIKKDEFKKEELKATEKSLNMLRQAIVEDKKKTVKKEKKVKRNLNIKVGDKVFVKSLSQDGVVLKVIAEKEQLQIQAGILKLVVNYDDVNKREEPKKKQYVKVHNVKRSNARSEVDLRGKMVDDAIHELEEYLDRAMLSGFNEVYIIHGKGTGALRKGIREYLRTSHYISEFRDADQNQGGFGCTVAKLK